eukprot:CAMPEP_0171095084 /NCGR_PEP_ID=MMETSP0766_2-20121228/42978_1 /TAXON_ID=439317 /ORGANISM="Gambierdiscus australes, Strain CAWD 149" /LENGTH=233 /DNA_ID=CAMNT_0011553857 /DNA_START=129 /DNA_END=826 /DNA_ORIENTATION=+
MALAKLSSQLERALTELGHAGEDSPRDLSTTGLQRWPAHRLAAVDSAHNCGNSSAMEHSPWDANTWDPASARHTDRRTPAPSLPLLQKMGAEEDAKCCRASFSNLWPSDAPKYMTATTPSTEANEQQPGSGALASTISTPLSSARCGMRSPVEDPEGGLRPRVGSDTMHPIFQGALVVANRPVGLGVALRGSLRPNLGGVSPVHGDGSAERCQRAAPELRGALRDALGQVEAA